MVGSCLPAARGQDQDHLDDHVWFIVCPKSQHVLGTEHSPVRGAEDRACLLLRTPWSLRICTQARQDTEGEKASHAGMR